MIKYTFNQVGFLLKRWTSIITFAVLTVLMLLSFLFCVKEFSGLDAHHMYHPMRMLALSYDLFNYNETFLRYITIAVPLLVAFPAGLSLANDRQLGEETVLVSRIGRKAYCRTRLAAVFISTMIVFSLPFLIEIVLNSVVFPGSAVGNFYNLSYYSQQMTDMINRYQFKDLYLLSPYLYAVVGTLVFGAFAGLMASFTYALTIAVKIKYRVFYILPAFLILYLSSSYYGQANFEAEKYVWFSYVFFFSDSIKSLPIALGFVGVLVVATVLITELGCREDTF